MLILLSWDHTLRMAVGSTHSNISFSSSDIRGLSDSKRVKGSFHFLGLGWLTYQVHGCPHQGHPSQNPGEESAWLPGGAPDSHYSEARAGTWRVRPFLQPWGSGQARISEGRLTCPFNPSVTLGPFLPQCFHLVRLFSFLGARAHHNSILINFCLWFQCPGRGWVGRGPSGSLRFPAVFPPLSPSRVFNFCIASLIASDHKYLHRKESPP